MEQLTQQNAALVEQAAAASQALAEQSNGLSKMMSRYKVRSDGVAATSAPAAAGRIERRGANRAWSNRSAHSG